MPTETPTDDSEPGFESFDLSEPLLRGLDKAGFSAPTPVQAAALPVAMAGHDLMAAAATGSGKTAAFLLPIMQRLLDEPAPRAGARALILVPTRELAVQTRAHFLALGSYTRLTAEVVIGGEPRGHQVASLRRNPDFIIATPGRLLEHLEMGEADLMDLRFLVLDEADRMLDLGLAEDVFAILGAAPRERQSMLFSATLNRRGVAGVAEHLLRDPVTLTLDHHREAHPDIDHKLILSDDPTHKQAQLARLLEEAAFDRALVFCNTRAGAQHTASALQQAGRRCALLHGEVDQRERRRVMMLFRDGAVPVLVASDVAARGLDVPGVELVINLDVPRSGDDYLHRSGRTGRAGHRGLTITLVSAPEWNRMESIERYLGIDLGRRTLEGLEANFKGAPKRRKPGKKASPGARKAKAGTKAGAGAETRKKPKQRLRDRKNIGKRRKPTGAGSGPAGEGGSVEAGFEPPKRRR